METKTCNVCGVEKPLSEFHWAPGGKANRCMACSASVTPAEKACLVCGNIKPASAFKKDASKPDLLSKTCCDCLDARTVRDGKKRCRGCLEWKLLDQFNSNGPEAQPYPLCRECRAKKRGGGRRIASDALIASGFKVCPTCGETKLLTEFTIRGDRRRNPYVSECKLCRGKRDRMGVPQRHGLTVEQWEKMLADQGGVCAICGIDEPGGRGQWHIDHDHICCPGMRSCGHCVRGLLCALCNSGVGMMRDTPVFLRRAAEYLEEYHLR